MGRPKEHDDRTAIALLDAAERIVAEAGPGALSVRALAEDVGTTTRAVYSLFGSKDGLLVALGTRAFDLLGTGVRSLAPTDDPAADLVEAGVAVFRRFAVDHPSLFTIGIQKTMGESSPLLARQFAGTAAAAFAALEEKVTRVQDVGLLGSRSVREAATQFHALCEGLAALELRGLLPAAEAERIWRDGLTALVTGFAAAEPHPHVHSRQGPEEGP